ncbi:TonB-dependent receptor family protein [Flagellimonas baculiformis]|uniref:TonB-dependent receptor family protein n=1 Tax=Flagellimonas baculiformis TaxID=3067310 RepID=UPI00296FE59C|nr:TonB-dependent receptor [Muricauda sp. D6]
MKISPLLYFFLAVPWIFFAQDQKKDSVTPLSEVVLIENGIEKRTTGITPSSTLVTAQMERNGPLDIAATINQISGVYLLSGALNTNRITIRGVGARTPYGTDKLRLYFNNIPVTNGAGFSVIEAYDLENMGAIEVVKGPKETALGTNLGGAIILNTKAPEAGSTFLANSASFGSYEMLKNNLAFRHSENDFNISLVYNHLETEGYRQNNAFERDGLLLTSSVKMGDRGKLDLMFNMIDYTAGIPSSLNQTNFEQNPTMADANWLAAKGYEANTYTLAGITYSHRFKGSLRNSTSVFHTYLDHYEPRPFNILDEITNGFGLRSVFRGNLLGGNFTLGGELYKDEYSWGTFENLYEENDGNGSLLGNRLSDNKEFRSQFNLFGTFELGLTEEFSAQVGMNLNKTTYDFRDLFNAGEGNRSASRSFTPILSPSLKLRYQLQQGQLFASVARGFSNPGLEETLTPEGVVNPDISQEKGVSYELGGEFWLLDQSLQVNATIYLMHIKDLLVAQRVGEDQYIGRNAGKTRHQGLELEAKYSVPLSAMFTLSPFMAYTLNDHSFVDFVDGDNDYSGNPLTGVPKQRISSGLDVAYGKDAVLGISHQFVDDIPLTDANTQSSDAYTVIHMSAKYAIQVTDRFKLRLNAGINNVFDTNYAGSVLINAVGFGGNQPRYFYPANGRNYYGGLGLTYLF